MKAILQFIMNEEYYKEPNLMIATSKKLHLIFAIFNHYLFLIFQTLSQFKFKYDFFFITNCKLNIIFIVIKRINLIFCFLTKFNF